MDLYDKPDTNTTSQIQITQSTYLIYVFPWAFFSPYSLCYNTHGWETDLLVWKTELEEQQSIPRWQNTPAPLRRLGLAHELNCTYQQIRLKPSLEVCSKQGTVKVQLSQSLPNMASDGRGSALSAVDLSKRINCRIASTSSVPSPSPLCQIACGLVQNKHVQQGPGGFYQFISCPKGTHCSVL